jgi:CHAT domain-containing protein/tetratricopeptide (TPR) repeat protein
MTRRSRSARGAGWCGAQKQAGCLCQSLFMGLLAASLAGAAEAEPGILGPGARVEGSIGPGETHRYEIALVAGNFVHLVVEQANLDLTAQLIGPGGRILAEVGNPTSDDEPLPLSLVVPDDGTYRLEVGLGGKAPSKGRYVVRLDPSRAATPGDEKRIEAEKAYADAECLRAEGSDTALREAIATYEKAVSLSHEAGVPLAEATGQLRIQEIHWSMGDLKDALDYAEVALSIFRSAGDLRGEASTLNALGTIFMDLSEPQLALDRYREALPIAREIRYVFLEAALLHNTGFVYAFLGEDEKALEYFERALPLKAGIPQSQATTLDCIGHIHFDLKNHATALRYFERALAIRQRIGDRRGQAITLNEMGWVFEDRGQKRTALRLYRQSLELSRSVGNQFQQVITLDSIGEIQLALGETTAARETLRNALVLVRQTGNRAEEAETLADLARVERKAGNLEKARALAGEAVKVAESVRADAGGLDLRISYSTKVRERYDLLIGILTQMYEREPATGLAAEALETSERARARGLLELLAESHVEMPTGGQAGAEGQTLTLSGVQELLDANTVLLEYSLADEQSFLWAVTPTSVTARVLPKRSAIEAAARDVQRGWSAPGGQPGSSGSPQAERLSRMLLAPVAGELGSKRLVIVADGALQYIPFGALPSPGPSRSGRRLLIDDHEIVTLPSASTLAALRRGPAGRKAPSHVVAVLADPVFSAADPRVRQAGSRAPKPPAEIVRSAKESGLSRLERLGASRTEAQAIASLAGIDDSFVALDFEASRAVAIGPDVSSSRVVHIASHGLLNSHHPELSGIVLSLVNERGEPENGFLRTRDIYKLKLSADLVVLSACQTALGKDVRGEGLLGLSRGFMYAGASRIVASLWQVPDRATSELMKHFYEGVLRRGLRPAAALREAQIAIRREKRWTSPYYWAAFTLQGDWN